MVKFIAGILTVLALQQVGWSGVQRWLESAGRTTVKAAETAQKAAEVVADEVAK